MSNDNAVGSPSNCNLEGRPACYSLAVYHLDARQKHLQTPPTFVRESDLFVIVNERITRELHR